MIKAQIKVIGQGEIDKPETPDEKIILVVVVSMKGVGVRIPEHAFANPEAVADAVTQIVTLGMLQQLKQWSEEKKH